MRIRLSGTRTECDHARTVLVDVLHLREISGFYPNRGASELGRVYLEVEIDNPGTQEGTNTDD